MKLSRVTTEACPCDLAWKDVVVHPAVGVNDNQDWNDKGTAIISSGDRVPVPPAKAHCDYSRLLYYSTRTIVSRVDELIVICLLQ